MSPFKRSIPVLSAATVLVLAQSATAAESFQTWLEGVRTEAAAKGISQSTLTAALDGIQPIARVIELDRKQPEFTLTFEQYLSRVVPASRVEKGRKLLNENRSMLEEVARKYGVQPRFIVALWGIETDFGRLTGGFRVVPALATLAHDGRRSDYFRKELFNALTILEEGHIQPDKMTGSWAGAMGQSQFMPSSFLNFAVDHDGDGHKDIWNTRVDVFASAANYLSRSGWRFDQTWGRQVTLPAGFDKSVAGLETVKRLGEWQALGLRRSDGGDLPARDLKASLILPGGEEGAAFLVYNNYRTVLKWNRSHFFAMAVGHLADKIGKG